MKKIQKNFKNNYASVECGAKILAANNEAKVTHTSLTHFNVILEVAELYDDILALMERSKCNDDMSIYDCVQ